ncbi:hypothetical protein [Deinococcus ruber]|uniref:Uncharacterized protein n=1 Tax=Deinococcus ruber TaxID=1848197 RepID=A0A918CE21_9DEIO|nr:hypothetical protein [Deinococcus ruber]GGR16448.1 hypothetical protein GCM10008957_31370 [Deinococcus ruber]
MKLSGVMYVMGAASILFSAYNFIQGKQKSEGHEKNEKQQDGNFIGHWAPTFFILGKIFEDHEKVQS